MERRLAVLGEHGIWIRAVRQEPAHAVRRLRPVQNRIERCRAVGGPGAIDVRAVREQQVERGDVAAAGREWQRDAVAGIGAGAEQDLSEPERTHHAHRAPENRPVDAVMQPGKAQVRIGAERDEPPRDGDEARLARVRAGANRR